MASPERIARTADARSPARSTISRPGDAATSSTNALDVSDRSASTTTTPRPRITGWLGLLVSEPFTRLRRQRAPEPNKRSVLPGARHPTKDVAVDRHMADGRKRQVSGHQRLAVPRQLPQKTDPDAGRLSGSCS